MEIPLFILIPLGILLVMGLLGLAAFVYLINIMSKIRFWR